MKPAPAIIRRFSSGPNHHFFGYYGICPWNAEGNRHLALETAFHDRAPDVDDIAGVGFIERESGLFHHVTETRAFNLQQGSMLHWIHAADSEEFTFNDWENDRVVSRAVDPDSGRRRTLGAAIAAVSPGKPVALGLNYARTYACRRVTGYANKFYSPETMELVPAGDGLFRIDLCSGHAELLLSIAGIERLLPCRMAPDQFRWIEHVTFNTNGTRILFVSRVTQKDNRHLDSLWTAAADGSGLQCLIEYGHFVSHSAWLDPNTVMISCNVLGRMGFVLLDVAGNTMKPMPIEKFPQDGHNAFSPDFRWIVCDTYPQGPSRISSLFLYDRQNQRTHTLGAFHHDGQFTKDCRCDLHPRWSRDGTRISFDSVHEGNRQIYEADVSRIVHADAQ